MVLDKKVLDKYINHIITDDLHRYKSWAHCHNAFSENNTIENKALHLAFYLASWGMYRGSSGLLQKNHTIHINAVKIILEPACNSLKCNSSNAITIKDIDAIMVLKKALSNYYEDIPFTRNNGEFKITPTDTLISKILLGTLGCVPAYDRFFIDGLKASKIKDATFSASSLKILFNFIHHNLDELHFYQKIIYTKTKYHYPLMKLVDMYFWQIGFDESQKK
jgi:hypothetical protein